MHDPLEEEKICPADLYFLFEIFAVDEAATKSRFILLAFDLFRNKYNILTTYTLALELSMQPSHFN